MPQVNLPPLQFRFVYYALAVYAITRILIQEEGPFGIFKRIREVIFDRAGMPGIVGRVCASLSKFVICPYCVSTWGSLVAMLCLNFVVNLVVESLALAFGMAAINFMLFLAEETVE